jgi:hypothetical protein
MRVSLVPIGTKGRSIVSAYLYGRTVRKKVELRKSAADATELANRGVPHGQAPAAKAAAQVALADAADAAQKKAAGADQTSGLIETVAGLFPADLLLVYAAVLPELITTTRKGPHKGSVAITDPGAFKLLLIGLMIAGVAFYVAGRVGANAQLERADLGRVLVAPLAFAAWAGLQKPNGWSVFGHHSQGELAVLAALCALAAIALSLAFPAKATPPPDAPAQAAQPAAC